LGAVTFICLTNEQVDLITRRHGQTSVNRT
jgi:hypothetical protein